MAASKRHHRSTRELFDQRSLALEEVTPGPQAQLFRAPAVRRLWFCVYLPQLPLEASGPGAGARIVVEEQQGIHRVLLACGKAAAAGIVPGQSANAALALLPALDIRERSALAEQQALEHLAGWLEQFSSVICLAGPDTLLVEIAGSLRLYGGLLTLRQQIAIGLEQQGFTASLAIAPTPLAATWLARAGHRSCIREPSNMATALRGLPVSCLNWPAATCEALLAMGIRTIGDCLRLPREGFARRFGPQRLLELDRGLGRLPDPRTSWRAPEQFCADHEMTEEQSDREMLLAICRELLEAHERFLLARQLGVQDIRFSFFHLRSPATQLHLGCVEAERRSDRWLELLCLQFEKLILPEPVIAVRLQGGRTQALHTESGRLVFRGKTAGRSIRFSVAQLAERLVARIGGQSVAGVTTVAEHRPQLAWRPRNLLAEKTTATVTTAGQRLQRPLWMLPEPARLSVEQGYPLHQGPLRILDGPERLETGWWDEDSIARDYYTAINPRGMRLWVFRNRNHDAGWYLHGFFG
jgi:protein ImuB